MAENPPLVSVIIPVFNKAPFIADTLDSVLQQTFRDFEIVAINDGSTDESRQILDAYSSRNQAIRVIHTNNEGVSAARNTAITHARGEYITAIDADDMMESSYLEKAVAVMQSGGTDLVSCYASLFGGDSGEWLPPEYDPYRQRYNNNIATLVTFSKDLWHRAGGYSVAFPFNEDWDLFVRCERLGLRVTQLKEKLFRYRVDSEGLAALFIKDTWNISSAIVATANEQQYSVPTLLENHRALLTMPERWIEKFKEQRDKHSGEWLPHFWLSLAAKSRGEINEAKALLIQALQLSNMRNWQPLYQLGELLSIEGDSQGARALFHQCRVVRPDTEQFVDNKIN